MISADRARQLAYEWHSGQDSPLYAFASSGLVKDPVALAQEIRWCLGWVITRGDKTSQRQLQQLDAFVEECVWATPPGAKWEHYYAPWAQPEYVSPRSDEETG